MSMIICSPPPIPEPSYDPLVIISPLPKRVNNKNFSFKNLQVNTAKQIIEINKLVRNYLEDGYIEDNEKKFQQ